MASRSFLQGGSSNRFPSQRQPPRPVTASGAASKLRGQVQVQSPTQPTHAARRFPAQAPTQWNTFQPGAARGGVKRSITDAVGYGPQGATKFAKTMSSPSAPVQSRTSARSAANAYGSVGFAGAAARPAQYVRTPQRMGGISSGQGGFQSPSSVAPWAQNKTSTLAAMQQRKPMPTLGRMARSLSRAPDRPPLKPQAPPASSSGKVWRPQPKAAGPYSSQAAAPEARRAKPVQATPKQRAQLPEAGNRPMTHKSIEVQQKKTAAERPGTNAESIKGTVKMRKVAEYGKRLIDEWLSLSQENKEKTWKEFAAQLAERVPPEFLAMLAEEFNKALANSTDDSDVKDEVQEDGYEVAGDEEAGDAEAGDAEAGDAEAGDFHRFTDAMSSLLEEATDQPARQYIQLWKNLAIDTNDRGDALAALIEVGARHASTTDLASKFVFELTKSKTVSTQVVEHALILAGGQLQELVEANDSAWTVWSTVLTSLFPKTASTTWGWPTGGWTWPLWWQMLETVISQNDDEYAFNMIVYILQMIQSNSGQKKIKDLQVWQQEGRSKKALAAVCKWGQLSEKATTELLLEYDIEL